jgi:hypothetical protein
MTLTPSKARMYTRIWDEGCHGICSKIIGYAELLRDGKKNEADNIYASASACKYMVLHDDMDMSTSYYTISLHPQISLMSHHDVSCGICFVFVFVFVFVVVFSRSMMYECCVLGFVRVMQAGSDGCSCSISFSS